MSGDAPFDLARAWLQWMSYASAAAFTLSCAGLLTSSNDSCVLLDCGSSNTHRISELSTRIVYKCFVRGVLSPSIP